MNDMLNTSIKLGDTNVTFNAPCTGMIQKSHPKSNFIRFHKTSKMADWIFSDCPRLKEGTYKCEKIIVLQIMVFGDNELLMEYVYEKDI